MAIINSGFLVENPMDLTEPLEKLIKVGFGLDRDAPVEDIEVQLDDDEEDEEEAAEEGEDEEGIDLDEIDLSTFDASAEEVMEEL